MKKRIRIMELPVESIKTIQRVHANVDKRRLKIGLLKMGGLGDAMTLKAFAKKVRTKYPDAYITAITGRFGVEVFDSGSVDHILELGGANWRYMYFKLKDLFDIFFDVGYVVRVVVKHFNERRVWEQLSYMNRLLDFYPLWERFPFSNKRLEDYQMSIFEIMNLSSGIDVREDDLEIETVPISKPLPERFATLHSGVGGKAFVKAAPHKLFEKAARYLRKIGVVPVQVGYKGDKRIYNADDYRGFEIQESAHIIKHAEIHLSCESGPVYLAKAVNTPAIVLFGATPVSCFGFKGNANLSQDKCRPCWWHNDDYKTNWFEKCRLGCKYCKNIPTWEMVKGAIDDKFRSSLTVGFGD